MCARPWASLPRCGKRPTAGRCCGTRASRTGAKATPRASSPSQPVTDRQPTIVCLTSFLKGQEFIRECKRLGCRVLLITVDKLRDEPDKRENDDVSHLDNLYKFSKVNSEHRRAG